MRVINLSSDRGFSLIEMMISITIGMLVIIALVGVLASNSRSSKSNDRDTELQSNGRFALDHLKRELRHAGYLNDPLCDSRNSTYCPPQTAITIANECLEAGNAAGSFVQNLHQGIWGSNDANPFAETCLPAANYLRGDVLVIRHVDTASPASLLTNTVYLDITTGLLVNYTALPVTTDTFIQMREHVYYIGLDDSDVTVPALRRITLKGNGEDCNNVTVATASMCDEEVVSGIEQIQVQFGFTGNLGLASQTTQYLNANSITGSSSDIPQVGVSQWGNDYATCSNTTCVNSARVWLLARNAKPEPGYANTTSYVMGNTTYTVNDSFRRQLFTTTVQVRNN